MNFVETHGDDPLKLLILPKDLSLDARICTIAHPRTLVPCRYLFCPDHGIYEFTRINPSKIPARSCLISGQTRFSDQPKEASGYSTVIPGDEDGNASSLGSTPEIDLISNGYMVKTAEYYIATPMDPLFLALPALASEFPSTDSPSSQRRHFLSIVDLLDKLLEKSLHFLCIMSNPQNRQNLEDRIAAVSDVVQAGDEKMYRLSLDKLLTELLSKAKSVVSSGLPASIEEKFVRKVLEPPMMGIRRQESSFSEIASFMQDEEATRAPTETAESQSSIFTDATLQSESTTITEISIGESQCPVEGSDRLLNLLRLRTALSYIMSSYISSSLIVLLDKMLASSNNPVNFRPLEDHLAKLTAMHAQALASRSVSDYSRKRGNDDDDDVTEARVEKKRKKEEEEKRKKAGESRSVRDLKKADTSGMKKLSSFFTKAPTKKK